MRDAPRYRLWPPLALGIPFVAGLAVSAWRPLGTGVPRPWRMLLAALLSVAFALVNGTAYRMMGRARTGVLPGRPATRILSTGPFRVSRNPLYVGLLLLYASVALLLDAGWALALLPVAFLGLHFGAVLPEETYLAAKFGEEYLSYKRRVRRWL
jgi:protein-S-isoprenylcysteine O-methyltransferase Ste14